jgi:hypothetical protein
VRLYARHQLDEVHFAADVEHPVPRHHRRVRDAQAVTSDVIGAATACGDLCLALACKSVSIDTTSQPEKHHRSRIKAGKSPL